MNRHVRRGMIRAFADATDVSAQVAKALADYKAEFSAFKEAVEKADKASKDALTASAADAAKAQAAADKAIATAEKIAANLVEIEQRIADSAVHKGDVPFASIGQIVVASAEYKALALTPGTTPGAGFKLRVEANTITGQGGSPVENVDTLVQVDRRAGIVPGAFRRLRVRDFLPTVNTTSNAWQFVRELLFTNNAAEVAEGASKAESVLTFEDATVNIRTIAHFIKASNQILADAPALRSYIDNRLRYGVELREETQIIAGNGAGQNISGMTLAGNFTAFTPTSGDNAIDSVNRAKYAIIAAEYEPTGVIMNPADWGAIERLKDGVNGGYLVGNPFGEIVPMLWGLPVLPSNSMTATNFHVADYRTSYEYVERQSTVVDIGYDGNDFTRNLVTIRAEKRGALATIRPASTRYGALTA